MEQMVAAGQGRRNRLAATAGGQRASGEGCFIWAHATHIHTPSVKPSSLLIPPAPKHTVCCHAAPEAKGRSSQNFSFANEVGRGWAEENRTAFICLICVFARTHTCTHRYLCVRASVCDELPLCV